MRTKKIIAVMGAAIAITGFAASAEAQTRNRSYQAYAIIDFETEARKGAAIDAAERVLQRYASDCPSSKHLAQVWRGVNGERASSGVGF